MGLRFRKSVTLCKGVRVNFGKNGTSVSFGTKGLRKTIHSSGRVTSSVGIPGTGLYYTTSSGGKKRTSNKNYSTTSYNKNQRITQMQQVQQEKQNEYAKNQEMIAAYNNLLERIRCIHMQSDENVDWLRLNQIQAPFDPMQNGPLELAAQKKLDYISTRFYEKWIPSLEDRRRKKVIKEIEDARQKDSESYNEWESLNKLSSKVLAGDIDSYLYVIAEMHPFDDILDFGSDFEVGTDCADTLEVEFRVKSEKVVPKHVLSITKTGKLSSKEMTKTQHYDIVQDYICSCVIRIARDIFALLPVNKVYIHAVDIILNTATGYNEDATILSVAINRERFEGINFQMIDPSDTISSFEHNMDFKKTQGLKPVNRIQM